MGQQQLLIIVLVIMLAYMAVWGGLHLIDSINQSNERDLLIQHMQPMVIDARRYAMKPTNLGGGGGSFLGYVAAQSAVVTDRFHIYVGTTGSSVTLTGFGSVTGTDEVNPVEIIVTYTSAGNNYTTDIIN